MKRVSISIVTALLAAILITSAVFAGKIRLSGSASIGSIHWNGYAYGIGNTDLDLEMTATGHAAVICTNYGSNDVPGQSSPKIFGSDVQTLPGEDPLRKNGRAPVSLSVKPDEELDPIIPWDLGGCPNPNWTARVFFVYWDSLIIQAKDPATGVVIETFNFACTTTYIPQNDGYTFDDGTVVCKEIK